MGIYVEDAYILDSFFQKLSEGGLRPTERSVFKIIFVKLANFRANILEAQGDFSGLLL